jgi:dTMP kinase
MKYKLVAFEGIDGSGKSTQIQKLAEFIRREGDKAFTTCEPTDNYIGKIIRDIFSHRRDATQETIAGLFVADRLQHLLDPEEGMLKQLETGHVLTDRYYFSSYAYHGVHVDMDWVIEANAMAVKKGKADLHVFIDVDPEISLERILASRQHVEMYETLDNLRKVRDQYLKAFEKLSRSEHVVHVDGNRDPEAIASEIQHHFRQLN